MLNKISMFLDGLPGGVGDGWGGGGGGAAPDLGNVPDFMDAGANFIGFLWDLGMVLVKFVNLIGEFLFKQITIGEVDIFGWVITEGFTFSLWYFLFGTALPFILVAVIIKKVLPGA